MMQSDTETREGTEAKGRDTEAAQSKARTDGAGEHHDSRNQRNAHAGRDERSLGTLLSSLFNDLSTLMSKEFALARSEASETTTQVTQSMVSFGVAVVVSISGFTILLTAAVLGLNYVLWPWLSALIIGVLFCGIGLILMLVGRNRLKAQNLAPDRTVRSLERDRDLAKEHIA